MSVQDCRSGFGEDAISADRIDGEEAQYHRHHLGERRRDADQRQAADKRHGDGKAARCLWVARSPPVKTKRMLSSQWTTRPVT